MVTILFEEQTSMSGEFFMSGRLELDLVRVEFTFML